MCVFTHTCIFPLKILIFKEVLNSQQNYVDNIDNSHRLPAPLLTYTHSLPHYQHTTPEWYICYKA